jgi:phosphatidylserine synthase
MVSSVVLVLIHHPDVAESLPLHLYLPVLMFVLALLMISRLRFPKAVKRDKLAVNLFQGTVVAIVYYCGITRSYPEVLLGMGTLILISGIIAGRITRPT